nr:protease cofactor [Cycas necrotic stunt virus]
MGWICPNVSCLGHTSVLSNKEISREGRCERAMCGSLLVKVAVPQQPAKKKKQATPAPRPTYPPCVVEKTAATPVTVEKVFVEVIPTVPSCLAPKWMLGIQRVEGAPSKAPKQAVPKWVWQMRQLLKAALTGANSFGPRYVRAHFSRARISWIYAQLCEGCPLPLWNRGRALKKSSLALLARIEDTKQQKRAAWEKKEAAPLKSKREYEQKRALLIPLIEKLRARLLQDEARELREQLFPSGNGGTDTTKVAAASKAEIKAAAQLKAYQDVCAKVWRVKRQEKKAQQAKLVEDLITSANCGKQDVSEPAIEKAARPKRRIEIGDFVPQKTLWGLYPCVGLGANMADPVCRVLSACVSIAGKRPDLVSTIYAFITGEAQVWLSAPRVCMLAKRIIELSDWYPHELLAEELKKISDEENCKEAEREINLKYLEISKATENMRANGLFNKLKGKAQDLWSGIVDFASHPFRKYLATAAEFVEGFSHRVVDAVMSRVNAAIAQFAAQLDIAKTLVDQLVIHVKRWYTSLCTSFDDSLKLLGKWAGYALGLIVGVGVCHLVEVIC